VPIAPFSFELADYKDQALEGEDIELNLKLVGKELPEKVYLISDQGKLLMERTGRNQYTGKIQKVMESGSFYFSANDFVSTDYRYTILGRPTIGNLEATIQYPKYLGKQNEVVNNAGDLTVPEGTTVTWSVVAKNAEYVRVRLADSVQTYRNEGFRFSKRFTESA